QAVELLDASQTTDAQHQRFFRFQADLGARQHLAYGWPKEISLDPSGQNAHVVARARRARSNLASGEFADRDDARGQAKHTLFEGRHVAAQHLARYGTRLDPLRA